MQLGGGAKPKPRASSFRPLGDDFGEAQSEKTGTGQSQLLTTSASQGGVGTQAPNTSPLQMAQAAQQATGQESSLAEKKLVKPRAVGSFRDELIKRPLQDIAQGLKSIFDIGSLLGIKPVKDSPEDQAKKKQLHSRFKQLTEEEQAFAKQKYQQEMQQKQQEKEEKQLKQQQAEKNKARAIAPPSSPRRGAVGPGGQSRKSRAKQQLEDDRTKIGKVQGAN